MADPGPARTSNLTATVAALTRHSVPEDYGEGFYVWVRKWGHLRPIFGVALNGVEDVSAGGDAAPGPSRELRTRLWQHKACHGINCHYLRMAKNLIGVALHLDSSKVSSGLKKYIPSTGSDPRVITWHWSHHEQN